MEIELNKVGLIARLSVGLWQGNSLDKSQAIQVADRHGADSDRVRVMKRLIDQDDIKPIRRAANDLREFHKLATLPWNDTGERLLPMRSISHYQRTMDKRIADFNGAVRRFMDEYDVIQANARRTLGSLYEEHLFPLKYELEDKFHATYGILPAPDASHISGGLLSDPGMLKAMQDDVEREIGNRVTEAMKEPFQNIGSAITQLAAKLKETDENGKPPIFHDSSFKKIQDLIRFLPSLNITGDPALAAITDELTTVLAGVAPQELRRRDKDTFNQEKADQITETINRLQRDYGAYFTVPGGAK